MTDRSRADRKAGKKRPYVHRLSRETLMALRDASAEARLQWLEEATAFIRQFVSEGKRSRWEAFITKSSGR